MADTVPAKRRRTLTWVILAVFVAVIAVMFIRGAIQAPVPVRVAAAVVQDLTATASSNGVTEPVNDFQAHSPLNTTVKSVPVHEGQQVSSGTLLMALDDTEARSAMARAQAAVRAAEVDVASIEHGGTTEERLLLGGQISGAQGARDQAQRELATLQSLHGSGAASQAEVDAAQQKLSTANASLALDQSRQTGRYAAADTSRARATLADAQAQEQSAAQTLKQSNIRAPFAGTVYALPVHVTDYVTAGQKLLAMADLSKLRIRAYFDEPEIGRLQLNQPATITWAARPSRTWHGRIVQVPSTIIHYGARSVGEVLLSVDETDGSLLPETNVTAVITSYSRAAVLTMPREALHMDGNGSFVFVIAKDRLRRRAVRVGATNATLTEVLEGVSPGEYIVLGADSGATLDVGMKVHASN